MTDEAKAARREYKRQWRKNNPDKVKAQQDRYWQKKAEEAEQEMKQKDGRTEN